MSNPPLLLRMRQSYRPCSNGWFLPSQERLFMHAIQIQLKSQDYGIQIFQLDLKMVFESQGAFFYYSMHGTTFLIF
jgi:hypothetical protein